MNIVINDTPLQFDHLLVDTYWYIKDIDIIVESIWFFSFPKYFFYRL